MMFLLQKVEHKNQLYQIDLIINRNQGVNLDVMKLMTYQQIYPSPALLRSSDVIRPRAGDLLVLEYFEAESAEMPKARFSQHHVLLNLRELPHRVENWREGEHFDYTIARDDVVITPAGLESGWYWHEKSRVIVITLDPERLERFARLELGLLLTANQLRDIPQQQDADLCQTGTMLLDALNHRSAGAEVMYESFARIFLVKLLQRYGEVRAAELDFAQGFTAERYARVLAFIGAHFGEPITIEDMASEAALSPAHFSRLFRAALGETPYQFLMDYRIEKAKTMLAEPGRPIIDIALACGFADQPHFTRIFKRLTGKTPRDWRQNWQ
jgi:AraC family transcriptional regulator